jgi:hypothetical protein
MECTKSETDLFTERPIQTVIKSSRNVGYKSVNTLDNESQLEFYCPADSESFRDYANCYLRLLVKMVKPNNEAFGDVDTEQPGCVNYLLNSLFSSVQVYLNEVNINDSTDNYPYRALIETLFNHSDENAKTHLTNAMFYLDTADSEGVLSAKVGTGGNAGFNQRSDMLKNSKVVELYGRLHVDLFNVPQLMLSSVSLRVKLNRSSPEFYMLSTKTAPTGKIKILDATLFVKQVELSPAKALDIERQLARHPSTFHLNTNVVKDITIQKGVTSVNLDNAISGTVPKYIIVGLVKNSAKVGEYGTNPFEFIHKSLNYINVSVGGVQINEALRPDFNKIETVAMAYQTLFSGLGMQHDHTHMLTKLMYFHGFTFFCFDLTPDGAGIQSHSSVSQSATIRIEFRFQKELEESLSCIIYAAYDSTVFIDKKRAVTVI